MDIRKEIQKKERQIAVASPKEAAKLVTEIAALKEKLFR